MDAKTNKPELDKKAAKIPAAPKAPAPPPQSQIDQERSDWEGMGQSRYQPDEEAAKSNA